MIDPTLVHLAKVIQHSWPENAKDLPDDIKPYFPYKFVLHIVDGVITMEGRMIVGRKNHWSLLDLNIKFLEKIHEPHLGVVKSKIISQDSCVLAQV